VLNELKNFSRQKIQHLQPLSRMGFLIYGKKHFFIAGLALLAILSVLVFNNFRVRNKLRLQHIRNKIASDLHDDIGSTLNSISVYSEVANKNRQPLYRNWNR